MTGVNTIEYEARIEGPVAYTRPRAPVQSRIRERGSLMTKAWGTRMESVITSLRPIRKNLLKSDYSRWKK